MKKALSLLFAVVMIVLLLPITMLPALADETETETTAATIKDAKMYSKYSDGRDVHVSFGSVAGMIDGDPYDEFIDKNGNGEYDKDDGDVEGNFKRSSRPYYESDTVTGAYTDLYVDSVGETRTYYGYAVFELNGTSSLDDMTIWLTANAYNESQTVNWRNPANTWGINDGYEILVSTDGETWTFVEAFTEMCGDGTNKGANFPSEGDPAYATSKTADGYDRVGHKIALNGIEAKYVAIAVTAPSTGNCIDIGEVTVNGTVVASDADEKTPAQIYEDANEGDRLQIINFNDMSWSDDYADCNNWNTYTTTSADGYTVRHLIHSKSTFGANNMRAMWGGIAEEARFSLNGEKYTLYFDLDFGSSAYYTYGVGIQVDGDNTLVIDGFGCSYWYNWNSNKVSKSDTMEDKWNNYIDDEKSDTHSFAVEVDSENDTMTLYIATADGTYAKVREITYDDADISGSLVCRIYTTRVKSDKTINDDCWSEVSNIKIYKGLVGSIAPDASDDNETPDGGEGTTPDGGEGTTPDGGEGTTPDGGEGTTPDDGEGTIPDGGEGTTPDGGEGTTPDGGEGTTPDGGEGTTSDGGEGTTHDGGEGTTPDGGEETTPDGGEGTTPDGGEGTTPDGGEGTTSDGGEGTTPDGGEGTTPDGGEDNTGNENTGNENTGNENNDNGNTDTKDEAPTTEAPKTEEETEAEKSGCGSTLAMSGVALVGACAAMLAIKRRKNEDD